MRICSIHGCQKKHQSGGLCAGHRSAALRQSNPELHRKYEQARHARSRSKRLESMRRYGESHREQISKRIRSKYHNDQQYRLSVNIRNRVRQGLRSQGVVDKLSPTRVLTGCSWTELKIWLESKFNPGMSWENRQEWHIDHIRPLRSFDLSDPEQLKIACHYTNLQPLWKPENLRKGGRLCLV